MLISVGSFAGIWLLLWVLLGLLFAALYPLVRPSLFRLHPSNGSAMMLVYWSAPVLLSLLGTILLFAPFSEQMLVDTHCHAGATDCQSHVPMINSPLLAGFGLACLGIVIARLMLRGLKMAVSSQKLYRQFGLLTQQKDGYYLIDAKEPVVFTLGWLRPKVYISRALIEQCSEQDLAVILAHEHAHRLRKDNLRVMVARLLSMGLPGEAAAGLMHDLQYVTEEACDFSAARQYGYITVAEVLLKVKRILMLYNYQLPAVARPFAETQVETRIKALLLAEERTSLQKWELTCICLTVMIALTVLIDPLHHGVEWLIGITVNH